MGDPGFYDRVWITKPDSWWCAWRGTIVGYTEDHFQILFDSAPPDRPEWFAKNAVARLPVARLPVEEEQ